jgi:ketosteroid isomerase-like protein
MAEHTDPRVIAVVRLLEAYRVGNLQSMQQWMAVDVTLEALGNNPLAGTYTGVGGVLAFIGNSMATFATDTVKIDNVSLEGDEVHVLVDGDMTLVDGGRFAVRVLQRYRFGRDGKVSWIQAEAAENQEEFDRLLTERARGV